MKKLLTMVCVLATAGVLSACETAKKEIEIYEARQAAERAEAKAEAALMAAREASAAKKSSYDASMRK
jgi:ABC-type uncharacterized transport system auxiliary subunit